MSAVLDMTSEDRSAAPATPAAPPVALTPQERRLRFWLKFWAAGFAIAIALYLWWVWGGPDASRAFAVNSVAKDLIFLILAVLVIADVRRFGRLMTVLVLGHVAVALLLAALLVTGATAARSRSRAAGACRHGLRPRSSPPGTSGGCTSQRGDRAWACATCTRRSSRPSWRSSRP
jgi:hypothetical protein